MQKDHVFVKAKIELLFSDNKWQHLFNKHSVDMTKEEKIRIDAAINAYVGRFIGLIIRSKLNGK